MSLSKQHFEHMAEHIARSTKEGSPERKAALEMAHSLGRHFNSRYDAGRMEAAVHGLSTGTHTVGDSGRIKRVGRSEGVKKLSGLHYTSPGAKLIRDVAEKSLKRSGGVQWRQGTGWTSRGGAGDEPRDERGRWTNK